MSVKGFKNYDEEGNFLGVEKYDYNSLEGIPKNFKNDTYEQDIQQLKTDVEKNVTDHNVSKDAHNDIRLLITDIINRINVIADSDDGSIKDTIGQYFNLEYLFRYYLTVVLFGAVDSLGFWLN